MSETFKPQTTITLPLAEYNKLKADARRCNREFEDEVSTEVARICQAIRDHNKELGGAIELYRWREEKQKKIKPFFQWLRKNAHA